MPRSPSVSELSLRRKPPQSWQPEITLLTSLYLCELAIWPGLSGVILLDSARLAYALAVPKYVSASELGGCLLNWLAAPWGRGSPRIFQQAHWGGGKLSEPSLPLHSTGQSKPQAHPRTASWEGRLHLLTARVARLSHKSADTGRGAGLWSFL